MKREIIPSRFLAAPMAGITDAPFRKILRLYFDGIVFTEMASVMALKYNYQKESSILRFDELERPIGIQLFGKDPEAFYLASKKIRELEPDLLDINMGCPARKVISSGSGSALLNDPSLAAEIISGSADGFEGPLSVKIRLLDDENMDKTLDFIEKIINKRISFITVHLRTPKEKFNKPVKYEKYREIINYDRTRVVINGGIDSRSKIDLLSGLGAKYFMIGNPMLGKPQIFQHLKGFENPVFNPLILEDLMKRTGINIDNFKDSLVPYLHLLLINSEKPETGIKEFRKHFCWYTKGMKNSKEYRSAVFRSTDAEKIKKLVLEVCSSAG